jgi:thiol-disulfide isomerase/thioredoxin
MSRYNLLLLSILSLLLISYTPAPSTINPVIGALAPDIALADANGKIIQLNSLRGKMVLIDFWASWCKPCRAENLMLRRAYEQHKNDTFENGIGFEIYSISLDTDSATWQKAIKNDRLKWPSQVCDFKNWDSPAVVDYNFRYLPFNVLIDGKGVIIAKSLFGNRLEETLSAHLAD